MIKKHITKTGRILVEQTTWYLYDSEENHKKDNWSITTSYQFMADELLNK